MNQNPYYYNNFPSVAEQTAPNDRPSTMKKKRTPRDNYKREDYEQNTGKDPNIDPAGYEPGSSSRTTNIAKSFGKLIQGRKGGSEQDEKFINDNQQRQEEELHDLRQLLTDREREIDELKRLLRDSDEKSNKLKRRNEKLQGYIDNDESTLGHQQSDDVVLSQFRSLILGIKSWSNRYCGSSSQEAASRSQDTDFSIHWEEDHEITQNIFPLNQSKEDFIHSLSDVRQKRKFLRGWIGLHIAETIFRTLPSTRHPQGSGADIWIPDELGSHVNEVEIALLNSGNLVTRSDFNQWRSFTMSLLFKKYPGLSEETSFFMMKDAKQIVKHIVPKHDRDPAAQKLMENVYKPALELAQLLRRQRASWSVEFPYTNRHKTNSNYNGCIFDDSCMKDSEDDEEELRGHQIYTHKWVQAVVTPVLYKSGTIDGKQYNVEIVVEKAEVSCAAANQQQYATR
ncbi:hypothetical protein F4803DRAFT_142742 [Xylaria telfairii]|nr:hypothetical protein F4803DRAFT_142742 [Xylaria telfairii]